MSTLDYLINAALIGLVVLQIRGRRLDRRSLVLPLVLVGIAAQHYLHSIPTAGNDVVLIGGLALTGATLGTLAAITTHLSVDTGGELVAKAGFAAAALWIAGIGARVVFVYAAHHGAGHAIAQFSIAHSITGGAAWTAALVLMALAEVVARTLVLHTRAQRTLGHAPAIQTA